MLYSGIVSITFKEKKADEVIDLSVKAGLWGIEWSENHHINPGDISGAASLKKITEEAGLKIVSYGSYFRAGTEANYAGSFRKHLDTAAALGAPAMRIWAWNKGSGAASVEDFKRIADESSRVADIAGIYGIKIGFEWHRDTLTDTNESAIKLLDMATNKNLYCLWQPTPEIPGSRRAHGLHLLGKRLLNIHAYYWDNRVRKPLADGKEKWEEYLKAVDRAEDHCVLMEFVMDDSVKQFMEDAAILNNWINAFNAGY
jgi:sugar phosphate isomerase/epimerase